MTKKDYEAIAGIIRDCFKQAQYSTPFNPCGVLAASIAEDLAEYMKIDNPRFRRDQFLAACRGESYKTPRGTMRHYETEASNA